MKKLVFLLLLSVAIISGYAFIFGVKTDKKQVPTSLQPVKNSVDSEYKEQEEELYELISGFGLTKEDYESSPY